jgi:hypothetical protein
MYRALYRRAKQDGTGNIPSLARLAQDLVLAGCRPIPGRTLKRRLSDLKAWGWVRTDRRMVDGKFGGQRRGTNRYTLLVPLAHLPMVAPRSEQGKREGWARPRPSMVAPRSEQEERERSAPTGSYGGPTVPPATMQEPAGRTVGPVRPPQNRRSHRGAKAMVAPHEPPTVNQPHALKEGKGSQPVGGTSRGEAAVQESAEPPPARFPRVELLMPESDQLDHDPTAAELQGW